jgi:polyphosphate kinase
MADPAFQPEHFINRELSWLEFNARVLEEAQDATNPLLERVKFLAIFASNLDEFFMVRVAGLREEAYGGELPQDASADGLNPLAQLERISARTRQLVDEQYRCWSQSLLPALAAERVQLIAEKDLTPEARRSLDKFFRQRIYPVLTPMAVDPSHPSPRFHNRGLYLAARLKRRRGIGPERMFAVVQLPQVLPRFVPVEPNSTHEFLLLEDVVQARLPELFGGYDILDSGTFRMTRDMDVDLLEQEADDLLRAIESRLRARQRSDAVRLEVSASMNSELLEMLVGEEGLQRGSAAAGDTYSEVYTIGGMLDMACLYELVSKAKREDLREQPFGPRTPLGLRPGDDVFAEIEKRDYLLHHPFDSFQPVVTFVERAARDPQVLAIKQTLYRTSGDSPVVRALIEAAENGKHVTALVELKARFDEANNITWAREMERAGVHVVFGFMDLKTHCKLAMVVRQEGKKVRRYVHLGSGNYNPTTALVYTDIGLFTADKVIADDVSALFNFLTGYSQSHKWQKLIVAPQDMQRRMIELIGEQAERARQGKKSRIVAKLNSLVDRKTIEALYLASQAGVPIDLVIRGICCLRPGLPGISENIRVRSIVDRFLEHSRIMIFGVGPKEQVFVGSADWMPRNFERRVEVAFPIESADLRNRITQEIMPSYLNDNQRARRLRADGTYVRVEVQSDETPHRSQLELLAANLPSGISSSEAEARLMAVLASGDGSQQNGQPGTFRKPKRRGEAVKAGRKRE